MKKTNREKFNAFTHIMGERYSSQDKISMMLSILCDRNSNTYNQIGSLMRPFGCDYTTALQCISIVLRTPEASMKVNDKLVAILNLIIADADDTTKDKINKLIVI